MRASVLMGAGVVALAAAGAAQSAHADRLAFLYDACADTRVEVQAERTTFEAGQGQRERDAAAALPPADFGRVWLASEKERLRPFFQTEIAPAIVRAGGSAEGSFDVWFGEMMGEVSEARRVELMTADYRAQRQAEAARARDEGEADLAAREAASLDACNADVRNRTIRFVSRTAAAPLKWVGLESASTPSVSTTEPITPPLASAPLEPATLPSSAPAPGEKSVLSRAARLLAAPLKLF